MQIGAGGLDRAVPGLGLNRLERHPGLAQPGQAGVAQLVAGGVLQPGQYLRRGQDLVQPFRGERLAAGRGPFNATNTRSVGACLGLSLCR